MNDENQPTQTENNQMSNTKTETMSENQLNQNEQMENVNTNENVENNVSAIENVDSNPTTTTPEKTQEQIEKEAFANAMNEFKNDISKELGIKIVDEVRGGKSHVFFKDKLLNSIKKELETIDERIVDGEGTKLRVIGSRKTPQGLQDKLENRFWKPSKTNENHALVALKVSGRRVNLFGVETNVGKPSYFTVNNDLQSIKELIIKLRDYIDKKVDKNSPLFQPYEEQYNKEIAKDKFAEINS